MRGKMAIMVAVVAVLVSCFLETGLSEQPEGAAVMRLKHQIDGTWEVFNKSSIGIYNESVGEVTFYSGGTEIEVTSGIFGAASMIHIDTDVASERCYGVHEMTIYTDEIGFVEWDSCDKNGNFRRIRKSPIRIILLSNDKLMMIGIGHDGKSASLLTRY